jgi:hypothetical protein
MTNAQLLVLILILIAAVLLFCFAILPFLQKKGFNLDKAIAQTQKALDTTTATFALLKPFLEQTQGVDAVDKILASAKVGVGNAEQLYKVGKLTGDERNKAAKDYVYDTLKLSGVAITPDIVRLVDGAVEAGVNTLGHATAQPSDDTEPPDAVTDS